MVGRWWVGGTYEGLRATYLPPYLYRASSTSGGKKAGCASPLSRVERETSTHLECCPSTGPGDAYGTTKTRKRENVPELNKNPPGFQKTKRNSSTATVTPHLRLFLLLRGQYTTMALQVEATRALAGEIWQFATNGQFVTNVRCSKSLGGWGGFHRLLAYGSMDRLATTTTTTTTGTTTRRQRPWFLLRRLRLTPTTTTTNNL